MKTFSSVALAAVLVAGLGAPAFAASSLTQDSKLDSDFIIAQLQQRGVNAIDVSEGWNDTLVVTVKLADGSKQFQYLDEITLKPVSSSSGTNTRVLSKLDVGTKSAPAQDLRSLADSDDGFFD